MTWGWTYEDVGLSVLLARILQPHQGVVETQLLVCGCIGVELERYYGMECESVTYCDVGWGETYRRG